jgi:DNA mismatch repair protein MutL
MNTIHVLPGSVVSKIAAGEVIEKPASVLKELIENSVDAGAETINIDFENAGKKLIRVNDDGAGLSPQDVAVAIKRHSTSKISAFEDLDKLTTFGFRGEALYSISAISKLTLKSSLHGALRGRQVYAEGGHVIKDLPYPPAGGTTVEVRDLFFNTPARRKFLKSDATEKSRLLKVVEESALVNTSVAFNVRSDGKEIYSLKSVFTGEITSSLNYVTDKFMDVKAFIGAVNRFSTVKNLQFFFVNKRPVTSLVMRQAMYKAMADFAQKNTRPVSFMYFNMSPDSFDVNIHPQKKEVRFKDEGLIYSMVSKMVAASFSKDTIFKTNEEKAVYYIRDKERCAAKDFAAKRKNDTKENFDAGTGREEKAITAELSDFRKVSLQKAAAQEEIHSKPYEPQKYVPIEKQTSKMPNEVSMFKPFYRFLGQIAQSYLLFETENALLVVDQHAAAERVLFEKYLAELDSVPAVQRFIIAVSIDMTASQTETVMSEQEQLKNAGFEIDRFGPKTIQVSAAPAVLALADDKIKDFVFALAGDFKNTKRQSSTVKRQKLARLACKKSVKAHQNITREEAVNLLKNLHACRHSNICPHGRPTTFSIGKTEISKKFHRTKTL